MVLNDEILKVLACPETLQALHLMLGQELADLNQRIELEDIKTGSGEIFRTPLDGALIREDRQAVYPIIDGIPILLAESALVLSAK